jgi:hypothetical protein
LSTNEIKEFLEKRLMLFYPEDYLPRFVSTIQDIFENRFLLRNLPCNNQVLNYLLTIIVKSVDEGKRFRTLPTLKVIKAIVKNKSQETELERGVVKQLFHLYKKYIFAENEEVQWCVSIFIKDQVLDDEDVEWLISNYDNSSHIINRLLRYPIRNELITAWAKKAYRQNKLEDRKSEVVAILIENDIPSFVKNIDRKAILWSIYYAKVPDEIKLKLLKRYASVKNVDAALDISLRLGYPSVIEYMIKQL